MDWCDVLSSQGVTICSEEYFDADQIPLFWVVQLDLLTPAQWAQA